MGAEYAAVLWHASIDVCYAACGIVDGQLARIEIVTFGFDEVPLKAGRTLQVRMIFFFPWGAWAIIIGP